jgi:hypothetical protein
LRIDSNGSAALRVVDVCDGAVITNTLDQFCS